MITIDFPKTHAVGFNIIDCEVRSRSIVYLLLRLDYTQEPGWRDGREPPAEGRLQKRLLALQIDNPDKRQWGVVRLDGLDTSMCSMAFAPKEQLIVVAMDSEVWAQNASTNGFEKRTPPLRDGGIKRGALLRARSFGAELVACTNGRDVLIRSGPEKWVRLGPEIPFTYDPDDPQDCGSLR